jgi:hypothetical protein
MSGSVEAKPLFHNNSYEFSFQSWFVKNPQWFVHGLVAGVCVINGGNMDMHSERFESVTDQTPNYWADVHLIECNSPLVAECNLRNVAMTAHLKSRNRTAAAIAFENSTHYLDITDERNYNVNTFKDYTSGNEAFTLRRISNLAKIIISAGRGISTSNVFTLEEVFVSVHSISSFSGVHAQQIVARHKAAPTMAELFSNCTLKNASVVDPTGVKFFATVDVQNGPTGSYRNMPGHAVYNNWQAHHAFAPTLIGLGLQCFVIPATENGYFYQCTVAGTSGGSEPAWPRTIGGTVIDGGVTWTCAGRVSVIADVGEGVAETLEFGLRRRLGSTVPTHGFWQEGDRIVFQRSAIVAGHHVGLVCIAAGTPGTWKAWGPIER